MGSDLARTIDTLEVQDLWRFVLVLKSALLAQLRRWSDLHLVFGFLNGNIFCQNFDGFGKLSVSAAG